MSSKQCMQLNIYTNSAKIGKQFSIRFRLFQNREIALNYNVLRKIRSGLAVVK